MSKTQLDSDDLPNPESYDVNQSTMRGLSFGDVLDIDGDRYVVVKGASTIPLANMFGPTISVAPIDNSGATRRFKAAQHSIVWASDLPDSPTKELEIDGHIPYLSVERDGTDVNAAVDLTPTATERGECPECDETCAESTPIVTDTGLVVEPYKCTGDRDDDGSDGHGVFTYTYTVPEPDTTTVTERHRDNDHYKFRGPDHDTEGDTELSGVYERYDSDDFKLSKEDHVFKGVYTASEVAAFANPKVNGDSKWGYVEVSDDGDHVLVIDDDGFRWNAAIEFERVDPDEIEPRP